LLGIEALARRQAGFGKSDKISFPMTDSLSPRDDGDLNNHAR